MANAIVTVDKATARDKTVTISCSSGTLNFSAHPGDDAARTESMKVPVDGILTIPYRVGRIAETVRFEAAIDAFSARSELPLTAAAPKIIYLQTTKASVTADGADMFQLRATLSTGSSGGQVSVGSRMLLRACCVDAQSSAIECPGVAPLRVPPFADLNGGETIETMIVGERIETSTPTPVRTLIVAEPGPGAGAISCGTAAAGRARAEVVVIPIRPRS